MATVKYIGNSPKRNVWLVEVRTEDAPDGFQAHLYLSQAREALERDFDRITVTVLKGTEDK